MHFSFRRLDIEPAHAVEILPQRASFLTHYALLINTFKCCSEVTVVADSFKLADHEGFTAF